MPQEFNVFGKADTLNENLILGAKLTGKFDFPDLKPVTAYPKEVLPFSEVMQEKKPKSKFVHFFIDDIRFEKCWNAPRRYLETIKYFAGVISPDFSAYGDMPKACAIWNIYRSRVLAYFYQSQGLTVIPTVNWIDADSFEWIFDGLPQNSTLAVSTNGCHYVKAKQYYINGMIEMERQLKPRNIICIGAPIDVPINTPITYFDGYSQIITKKLQAEKKEGEPDGRQIRIPQFEKEFVRGIKLNI